MDDWKFLSFFSLVKDYLFELNWDDGVCSRGGGVHGCGGNWSVPSSFLHLLLDALVSVYKVLAHALNVNPKGFVLPDFVSFGRSFIDGDKEILHFLIINFHHGDVDFVLLVCFVGVLSYSVENFLTSDWDDSFVGAVAYHRVRLSCSCLSVGEKTAMVPLPSII